MQTILLPIEYSFIMNQPSLSRIPRIRLQSDMKYFLANLLGIWLTYVILVFVAPAAETVSRYGLTLAQAQFLRVTITVPLLLIWVAALFSVVWFRRYTKLISGSEEEPSFKKLTMGLWMLLIVIVLPSFVTAIANYYPGDFVVQRASTIIRNYITVSLYLVGFYYLWQASKSFLKTINASETANRYQPWIIGSVAVLAVMYTWAVLNNSYRSVSPDPIVKATYYLPDVLIFATIVIPYILIWAMGASAVINLINYAKNVPGVIYRQTFSWVAYGLIFTIGMVIGYQFLTQANASVGHAALKIILIVIYGLLLAMSGGYLFVARGARRLTKIEEIE